MVPSRYGHSTVLAPSVLALPTLEHPIFCSRRQRAWLRCKAWQQLWPHGSACACMAEQVFAAPSCARNHPNVWCMECTQTYRWPNSKFWTALPPPGWRIIGAQQSGFCPSFRLLLSKALQSTGHVGAATSCTRYRPRQPVSCATPRGLHGARDAAHKRLCMARAHAGVNACLLNHGQRAWPAARGGFQQLLLWGSGWHAAGHAAPRSPGRLRNACW